MEQTSKRRKRKGQAHQYGQIPANELADLVNSGKNSNQSRDQPNEFNERRPSGVLEKPSNGNRSVDPAAAHTSQTLSVKSISPVVPNMSIIADCGESCEAVEWQDEDGKYHRIDGEHRLESERHPSVAKESPSAVTDEPEKSASSFKLAELFHEIAELKSQQNRFAVERQQLLSVDREREASIRSERLALIRERELLVQERELLVQERALLAADRKQFFLDREVVVDRSSQVEPRPSQMNQLAETLAAIQREFGIPVPKSETENRQDDGIQPTDSAGVDESVGHLNMFGSVPATEEVPVAASSAWWKGEPPATSLDLASILQTDRGDSIIDECRPQDLETAANPCGQSSEIESNPTIGDLRSHLTKLFDLPVTLSVESDSVTGSHSPSGHNSTEMESAEQIECSLKAFDDTSVDVSLDNHPNRDDSIDVFMAGLLARSRGSDTTTSAIHEGSTVDLASTESARPATIQKQVVAEPAEAPHFLLGPRHKQDKQSVRENLQLFRQVAHSSAQSALARHSWRQLRNATMTKGILLLSSLGVAAMFLKEPFFGRPIDICKASACCLAALLSGMEIHRAWRQWRKPVRKSRSGSFRPKVDSSDKMGQPTQRAQPTRPPDASLEQPVCPAAHAETRAKRGEAASNSRPGDSPFQSCSQQPPRPIKSKKKSRSGELGRAK